MFFADFARNSDFFRSLFSRAANAIKQRRALAPEGKAPLEMGMIRGSLN
jgi:hypothetical protein